MRAVSSALIIALHLRPLSSSLHYMPPLDSLASAAPPICSFFVLIFYIFTNILLYNSFKVAVYLTKFCKFDDYLPIVGSKFLFIIRNAQPIAKRYREMKKCLIALIVLIYTLSAAVVAVAQEPFKRGLQQISFIPKGQWITGVNVSYSQSNQSDYQFFVVENLNGDTYNFKVSPMLMYCFKDNLAAGGRFSYTRSKIDMRSADVVLDSETEYNVDNLYSISQNWYGTAAFRNYISLGNNRRFGMFNEVQLEIGGGDSKICNGSGDDLTGTYSRNFSINVGLAPGMVMFLNNYSAIEVNVGLLGFSYSRSKSITDQVYVAHSDSSRANFKINLFSISFGVAFYL